MIRLRPHLLAVDTLPHIPQYYINTMPYEKDYHDHRCHFSYADAV